MSDDRLTYVSLFSSAGVGCYGLKQAGFSCLATAELVQRRMDVQIANAICEDPNGYIQGDLAKQETRQRLLDQVHGTQVDLVIATPPCQGISVANHKKRNELERNSLVVYALDIIQAIQPLVFVLENVQGFLKAACQRPGSKYASPVADQIERTLGASYNWEGRVTNLKDFGSPSSRTRSLVIGVRKHLRFGPSELFPPARTPLTLRELIGHLPPLDRMGEASPEDPWHRFRPYEQRMRPWIAATPEGCSAFENQDPADRPHRIKDGIYVANVSKNGDKYTRNRWDKVPPCVHTRNDILASQNTVHPEDDRVFSIRELMLMMGIPDDFRWTEEAIPSEEVGLEEFYRRHELNIRQCLGEAVPTPVLHAIGESLSTSLRRESLAKNA